MLAAAPKAEQPPVQEPVATIQSQDPYDERVGVYFALGDMERLSALPAGTKLYAAPQPSDDAKDALVEGLEMQKLLRTIEALK